MNVYEVKRTKESPDVGGIARTEAEPKCSSCCPARRGPVTVSLKSRAGNLSLERVATCRHGLALDHNVLIRCPRRRGLCSGFVVVNYTSRPSWFILY